MPAKVALSVEQWETCIRQAREAEAAICRIGSGVAITLPLSAYDRLLKLSSKVQIERYWLTCRREDIDGGWYSPAPDAHLGPERHSLPWFRNTKPNGTRKRPLARPEWAVLGEQAKLARQLLTAVGMTVQMAYPLDRAERWFRFADALDRLKSGLDGECCRQHPDWSGATSIFYGPTLAEDAGLSSTLDLDQVAAIRDMDEATASGLDSGRGCVHWQEALMLLREPAGPACRD